MDVAFTFGEGSSAYESCSVTFQNEVFMFGGNGPDGATQISKVVGCQLERIGDLDFSFSYGACTNRADAEIFLCFSDISGEGKRCRSSFDPEAGYVRVADSNYDHTVTRISASECKQKPIKLIPTYL